MADSASPVSDTTREMPPLVRGALLVALAVSVIVAPPVMPPGTARLKKGGGHGGHNGLRDIIRHCGADFVRLRIGVGHPGEKDKVTGYVLKRASSDVETLVERNVDEAVAVLPVLLDDGLNAAMKKLHTKKAKED